MAKEADAPKQRSPRANGSADRAVAAGQPFSLEQAFPDPGSIFLPHGEVRASDTDVLIALDANTLLVPYRLEARRLESLRDIYMRLSGESRLYLPARAAREFARNRRARLSECGLARSQDVMSRCQMHACPYSLKKRQNTRSSLRITSSLRKH